MLMLIVILIYLSVVQKKKNVSNDGKKLIWIWTKMYYQESLKFLKNKIKVKTKLYFIGKKKVITMPIKKLEHYNQ